MEHQLKVSGLKLTESMQQSKNLLKDNEKKSHTIQKLQYQNEQL